MSGQPEIHDRTFSQVTNERIKAAKQLGALFEVFPERKQAFEDLLKLSSDRDDEVREEAINSLITVFPNIPDKELAWEKFINLTAYPAEKVMKAALRALVSVFPLMSDKNKAWENLVELINSKTSMEDVNREIINAFPYLIREFPDKQKIWKDLLEITHSDNPYVKEKAITLLKMVFPDLRDEQKEKAWEEILKLTTKPAANPAGEKVKVKAAEVLIEIFPEIPERMKDRAWDDLLGIAISENSANQTELAVQEKVLHGLPFVFSYVPDKEKTWNEILKLVEKENGIENARKQFTATLNAISSKMPDKNKVWTDFLQILRIKNMNSKNIAIDALASVFPHMQNKDSAWKELLEFIQDEDEYVRRASSDIIRKVYPYLPDREKAYTELANAARENGNYEINRVLETLETTPEQVSWQTSEQTSDTTGYSNIANKLSMPGNPDIPRTSDRYKVSNHPKYSQYAPFDKESFEVKSIEEEFEGQQDQTKKYGKLNKKPAFESKKSGIKNSGYLEKDTVEIFSKAYPDLPDKDRIIEELVYLSSNPDPEMRKGAIESLLALYSKYSGKTQDIWSELLTRTEDQEIGVRKNAAELLPYVFPGIEKKAGSFFDLIKLTESQDAQTRKKAAELFVDAFTYVESKQKAWEELVRLASVEDREVRRGAILALAAGYAEVPDKRKGWRDLIRLSGHNDSFVQRVATRALGPAFFYAPDKTEAWRDLQVLTDNPYIYVRKYALRSLGRASLWRALRAENEATYIFGLKEAVKYFKEAAETSVDVHVPEFYYPFYEALLFILFSERPGSARLESERYFSKITGELKDQAENKKLIEILEQFAALLRSAGDIRPGDLAAQKKLLETCIRTFDIYSNFLENKEEKIILTQKPVKKGIPKPGKDILAKVEKKKSFLLRKP